MADVTEKMNALERRLDKLSNIFDDIQKSVTTEHRKGSHSVRTKTPSGRPTWVEEIVQHFNEISAELKSVKKTLETRLFTDNGNSNTEAAPDPELQHEAPSQSQSEREQVSPAGPEGGDQVATHEPGISSPPAPPGQNITTPPPQAHHVPVVTPSTSTEALNATTQEGNAPIFHCSYKDISGDLNEAKFAKFSSNPTVRKKGYFKLAVKSLPPLNVKEASFNQPGKGHCTNFSYQPDSRGFVEVIKEPNQRIKFPDFPLVGSERESWSQQSLKEFWESNLKDPAQNTLYVIGDPLFPDIELSAGEGLKRIGGDKLRGIGTTYIYLCFGVSFSSMHGEDAKFRSMNLLRSGEHKLWLVVEPAYEQEVERRMRQEFPKMAICSQALRHLSRVIAPSKLDEWNIPYSLDYCKPGEAIVTEPGAFHEVLNVGPNYAIAINVLYGSSPTVPKGYEFCQKSCDPHAITAAHLRLHEEVGALAEAQANKRSRVQDKVTAVPSNIIPSKRKAILAELELLAEVQAKKRSPLQRDEVTAVPSKIIPSKRIPLPAETQSRMPLLATCMDNLSEAVCGKEAFLHLCCLIRSWRDRSKSLFEIDRGKSSLVQLVNVIGILGERSLLTEFLDRLAKLKLAEIIDEGKRGRSNADPSAITNLIHDLEWKDTQKSREKLRNYLKDGRKWKRVCGSFEGMLCLIPPNREDKENGRKVTGRMYRDMSDDDIQQFHSLLASDQLIEPMCRVGYTFQASLWDNTAVPEFRWESKDLKELARLSMNKLVPFIEEFRKIDANECHFEKYDWPKPDYWPWGWPQYPTWVPPSDKLCDLCDLCELDDPCDCIAKCLPSMIPEITNEGKKGQGVRAIGTAYRKDQILGELLGELVPLDTYQDGWAMEFRRPDLDDEPIAQIYSGEIGNWVRKVNHSCAPSAEFRVMKISCWSRQMIITIEDIPHNGEITASCGRSFLGEQGKECCCSVHG